MRQLPTQWAKLAEARGISGSANALALRAGIATTTLTRLVFGGSTSPDTIRKVAAALGVSQERIRELANIPTPLGVWVPPEQANQLDQPTRDALDALILAIARGGSNADATPDQKTAGGDGAAPVVDLVHMTEPAIEYELPRAARRRTTHPEPTPDLDAQAQAGEENQDLS